MFGVSLDITNSTDGRIFKLQVELVTNNVKEARFFFFFLPLQDHPTR
jgi:hypothetical protein